MGSIFHFPVLQAEDELTCIRAVKEHGIRVVGADIAGRNYWTADLTGPTMVLIGNEGAGLPDQLIDACDEVVSVPMPGRSESLNAAISASLIMYEGLRQKWLKESKI